MKYIKYLLIIISILIIFLFKYQQENYNYKFKYVLEPKYIYNFESYNKIKESENKKSVLSTFFGTITGYGPDCDGCIGITASGYDVRNTIYYEDKTYNKVRILAADKSIPFGTIIKISNIKNYEDFLGIVLDRGSAIGFNKYSQIDLLFSNEKETYEFGRINNVTFEILREGYWF